VEYTVTAPEQGYSGDVAGAVFVDGSATVPESSTAALTYFRRRGYTVEPVGAQVAQSEPEATSDARPKKSASKGAWVAYTVAQGLDEAEANEHTRDELVELFANEGEDQ
jgi:hypothetical protein